MRARFIVATAVAAGIALLGTSPLAAQDPPPEEMEEVEEAVEQEPQPEDPFQEFEEFGVGEFPSAPAQDALRPIESLDRDELAREGFQFGTETDSADSSTGLLLAASAGIVVHGIGHLYVGDSRTGIFLLAMEGLSAVLVGSAATYYGLTDGESPAAAFFAPALQLGVALFTFSYLLDVIGTLQSDQLRLAPNTSGSRGIGFRARYGLFTAVGFPLRHVIDAMLLADIGGFYAEGATTQDIFLDAASYRGRVGVRPVRGASQLTFLSLEAGGEFFEYQGEGEFGRISADGRVGGSYQLGGAFAHLDQFALRGELGFGYRWYQFAPTGSSTFELAVSRPYVPFDVGASMNVSERLNLGGGYATSDSSWVPALQRMLGIAYVEFVYRSSSYGDISLRSEIGDGFALWLGAASGFCVERVCQALPQHADYSQ